MPSSSPVPRLIERVMLSFGTLSARASRIALASLRFMSGFPPPSLAAIWIARQSFDQSLPRRASAVPFLCLMVAQWECPDMRAIIATIEARVNSGGNGREEVGERAESQDRLCGGPAAHDDLTGPRCPFR